MLVVWVLHQFKEWKKYVKKSKNSKWYVVWGTCKCPQQDVTLKCEAVSALPTFILSGNTSGTIITDKVVLCNTLLTIDYSLSQWKSHRTISIWISLPLQKCTFNKAHTLIKSFTKHTWYSLNEYAWYFLQKKPQNIRGAHKNCLVYCII